MKNKKKPTINIDKQQAKLERKLKAFSRHFKSALENTKLSGDEKFLRKLSSEIKALNDDSMLAEESAKLHNEGRLVHHILSTPWGAPFAAEITLLDAALAFEYQLPQKSDLSRILKQFNKYGNTKNNEFLMIIGSLLAK